jgi:DNA polymerase-3 subunit delta'
LAGKIEHPDLHWYFPLPRPKGASTPEKLARALEEARAEALQERRLNPLKPFRPDGPRALYLAAARNLRQQAQRKPAMADRQVFIIAEAETLAPQESSSEAANALLKLLEEPPAGTTLILTSSEPGKLLPTIRSRTSQLHLPPLSQEEVVQWLVEVVGVGQEEAERVGALSQGSLGRALGFLPDGEERGPLDQQRREAFRLLSAALAPTAAASYQSATAFPSTGARELKELLDFTEEWLRELAMAASGASAGGRPPEDGNPFKEILTRWTIHPVAIAEAQRKVDEARALAAGNVNPQLVVFGLLRDLRNELLTHP